MNKKVRVRFSDFLKLFPKIDTPVTLSVEDSRTFSAKNKPLKIEHIATYIDDQINSEENELIEYIPCFRLKNTSDFHALIYFKADLMNYEYILANYDKKENLIEKRIIAGLRSNGPIITRAVATISEDNIIYIVEGMTDADERLYNPSSSKSYNLELMANGEIIFSEDEELT
jgi:hypothetical protein